MTHAGSLTVLLPDEGESWTTFLQRAAAHSGEVLLILSGRDDELEAKKDVRAQFLKECAAMRERLRIATKQSRLAADARTRGIRVLDRTKQLKLLLKDDEKLNEALRVFSPHLWRQQLRSRLQRIGLLSIPRIRIFLLIALSMGLFLFVVLRLLPSADIRIKPREEPVSQTMNLLLLQSGAVLENAHRIRTMPLIPITMTMRRSLTSTTISKEFIGASAELTLMILNKSTEPYSLRKGTRLSNQAGVVFKLRDAVVNLAPGGEIAIHAKAEDLDLYGQIIGERGNVPAGLKWEIPGLSPEERKLVYGENRKSGTGGTTAYRTVLRREDLEIAERRLEQEMVAAAKSLIEEEVVKRNNDGSLRRLTILSYPELTHTAFSGAVLPTDQLGKAVTSFTIETSLTYTELAYDIQAVLGLLQVELASHVRAGKRLVEDTLALDHVDVRVISYDDNLAWVKLTVELVGKDRYILDPLTPDGALFAKKVREKIVALPKAEALRIIKNMPEIETATIAIWPPWQRTLPRLPANISLTPQ